MSIVNDIGQLIDRSPQVRSGRPCIAGTGITVHRIVGWYKLGLSPEQMVDRVGHVSLAQVHAALAFYHANQSEIESDIASDLAEAERLQSEQADRPSRSS